MTTKTIDPKHVLRNVETAEKVVLSYRKQISEAAAGGEAAKSLGALVNGLASAEGSLYAWRSLAHAVDHEEQDGREMTRETFIGVAFDLMTVGPDDTWSGRGGDVARAYHDGILRATRDMKWM